MEKTKDPNIKYCKKCKQKVYFCKTVSDLEGHILKGNCVAFSEFGNLDTVTPLRAICMGLI